MSYAGVVIESTDQFTKELINPYFSVLLFKINNSSIAELSVCKPNNSLKNYIVYLAILNQQGYLCLKDLSVKETAYIVSLTESTFE